VDRGAPSPAGGGAMTETAAVAQRTGQGSRVELEFQPAGLRVRVPPGVTLFDAASWNGIAIDSTCGGHGTCKKCKVRVSSGSVPASPLDARAFSADELRAGWRLACRAVASADVELEVPPLASARQASRQPARSSSVENARASSGEAGTLPLITRTLHFLQVP